MRGRSHRRRHVEGYPDVAALFCSRLGELTGPSVWGGAEPPAVNGRLAVGKPQRNRPQAKRNTRRSRHGRQYWESQKAPREPRRSGRIGRAGGLDLGRFGDAFPRPRCQPRRAFELSHRIQDAGSRRRRQRSRQPQGHERRGRLPCCSGPARCTRGPEGCTSGPEGCTSGPGGCTGKGPCPCGSRGGPSCASSHRVAPPDTARRASEGGGG
jgi:hypothetical protein